MNVQEAYNQWAAQYDTNNNRTRDLEAKALREITAGFAIRNCLEIGCGTGKNTQWLVEKAQHVTAVDLSPGMLAQARQKIASDNVVFQQADITQPWTFAEQRYDLVTFSLVLEHIENLGHIFQQAAQALLPGGHVYIGELHPFKQYAGTKARFETSEGTQVVTCFNHAVSDFTHLSLPYGFTLEIVNEYFDDDDRTAMPRILALLLKRTA
jgi:ubiquinone/menaquinone biosynthesis C-methylase UbiE